MRTATTAEDILAMGDLGRCELIDGEVIPMAPAGAEHGGITMEVAYRIKTYVDRHKLGKVYAAETGFLLARNPDTIRAPDVAFVRADRLPPPPRRGYFDGAPDLAVEVVSPGDTHSGVRAKVEQWLAAGTRSVWVVDPPSRGIDVHHAGDRVTRFRESDALEDEIALPGFSLALADVF